MSNFQNPTVPPTGGSRLPTHLASIKEVASLHARPRLRPLVRLFCATPGARSTSPKTNRGYVSGSTQPTSFQELMRQSRSQPMQNRIASR